MVTESSDARFEPSEYLNRSRHYKNVMQNYCKLICMIILYKNDRIPVLYPCINFYHSTNYLIPARLLCINCWYSDTQDKVKVVICHKI